MSPVETTAGALAPGATAASERVQELQKLAAELRGGPASFAAALAQASASSTGTASATPGQTAIGQTTFPQTALASYGSAAPGGASSASAVGGGSPSATGAGARYAPMIEAAAARNGVDPAVLHGLIQQESGFDPSSRSSAGAEGLTQLMPSTASSLGVSDPLDPAQSIEGGARYLGEMLRRFGGNVEEALAAYNAGPGAVQQYGGVPPYAETQQYVSKVLGYAADYRGGAGTSAAAVSAGTGAVPYPSGGAIA
jgi:soluble lytic murein transglycosylase-like protein